MTILTQNHTTGWYTQTADGRNMRNLHPVNACASANGCAIHNRPSQHPLVNAPLNWREDRGILERVCVHGIGHPDHDAAQYLNSIGKEYENIHGCDGCC